METLWLLNVSCCLLQTLLSLTTLDNSFVYDQKKTINIVLVFGSFVLSDYLFVDGMISITSFQYPIFYNFFVNSTANYIFLSDTTLSSNLCNFYMSSMNSLTNLSTIISSVVATKCVILDNLLHTTKIAYFPTTNGNFVIKFTIKYIHGLSSILFAINFPTSASILLFIL